VGGHARAPAMINAVGPSAHPKHSLRRVRAKKQIKWSRARPTTTNTQSIFSASKNCPGPAPPPAPCRPPPPLPQRPCPPKPYQPGGPAPTKPPFEKRNHNLCIPLFRP